jgi:hypothetical protein
MPEEDSKGFGNDFFKLDMNIDLPFTPALNVLAQILFKNIAANQVLLKLIVDDLALKREQPVSELVKDINKEIDSVYYSLMSAVIRFTKWN